MTPPPTARNVLLTLIGVAALMLKHRYAGPLEGPVHDFGGNLAASFAVYFIVRPAALRWRLGSLATAGIALLAVELFEATDGLGLMANTYDPVDFAANAIGVGLALAIDTLLDRIGGRSLRLCDERIPRTPERNAP